MARKNIFEFLTLIVIASLLCTPLYSLDVLAQEGNIKKINGDTIQQGTFGKITPNDKYIHFENVNTPLGVTNQDLKRVVVKSLLEYLENPRNSTLSLDETKDVLIFYLNYSGEDNPDLSKRGSNSGKSIQIIFSKVLESSAEREQKNDSCSSGWKCKTEYHKAYQNSDCSWKSTSFCESGCEKGSCLYNRSNNASSEINTNITQEIEEQVKCRIFYTDTEQTCGNGEYSCTGEVMNNSDGTSFASCTMNVKGKKDENLTWKSSCGGYAYTVIDGINEYADFKCKISDNQKQSCFDNGDCSSDKYCEFDPCEIDTGKCVKKPEECIQVNQPVCGCDGRTYFNDCIRQISGVSKDHDGKCGQECYDSDGGKDYYVKGKVSAVNMVGGSGWDTCYDSTTVREFYCENKYYSVEDRHICPQGCVDGVCVKEPEQLCTDSDVTNEFPGGKNYFVKGKVSAINMVGGSGWDTCYDSTTVREFYCENKYYSVEDRHSCPQGCVDGVCVREVITGVCQTSVCNGGQHSGGMSYCCEKGYGVGTHFSKYDDDNYECWSRCKECLNDSDCPSDRPKCSNGTCIENPNQNNKLMDKYLSKEVFLISDQNWKDVLSLVPLTTWTGSEMECQRGYGTPDNVCVYPTLIYHDEIYEGAGFDVDSIIYFMQQYSPDKVIIVGETPQELDNLLIASPDLGAGLKVQDIQKIGVNDYFGYWEYFDTVVYVEDNYELALLASTYASLINAPLIIEGSLQDSEIVFNGRNVICVGDGGVSPAGTTCSEQYNLEQLRQKHVDETDTDKIILVNPTDWNYKEYRGNFQPVKTAAIVQKSAYKTSLISPFLASAKHELIVSTIKEEPQDIANFIQGKILEINANYLTIIAAIDIPHKMEVIIPGIDYQIYNALDSQLYADTNGDYMPDIAVGRIWGVSSSDVSTYLAKVLFYNNFEKENNMKFMASSFFSMIDLATRWSAGFNDAGYNAIAVTSEEQTYNFDPAEWENQDLIVYQDHGSTPWAGISSRDMPLLDNSMVVANACLTCHLLDHRIFPLSFCVTAMKQGAVGYVGSVSLTGGQDQFFIDLLNNIYYYGLSLGESFSTAVSFSESEGLLGRSMIFLGDQTLNVNPHYKLQEKLIRYY